jgi:hypothetical protein
VKSLCIHEGVDNEKDFNYDWADHCGRADSGWNVLFDEP